MSSVSQQEQPSTNWIGSDDQFPAVVQDPPTDVKAAQLHLDVLPRKGSASPVLLALEEKCPPPEDRYRTVVPFNPPFRPFQWIGLPPIFFPALVNWSNLTLFEQRASALNTTREIYFRRADWVPVFETRNDQDFDVTVTTQVRIGLVVTNGTEASKTVKLRDSFVGLDLQYGHTQHTVSEEETQNLSIVDITYKVPANTTVYGYQRKYTFTYRVWFDINTRGGANNVGPDGAPRQGFINTLVHTEEILVTRDELIDRVVGVPVKTVPPPGGFNVDLLDAKTISDIVEGVVQSTKEPATS